MYKHGFSDYGNVMFVLLAEMQDATVRTPLLVLGTILARLARCITDLAHNGSFFNGQVSGGSYQDFHFITWPSQWPAAPVSRASTCCRLVVASVKLMLAVHARAHNNEQLFNGTMQLQPSCTPLKSAYKRCLFTCSASA